MAELPSAVSQGAHEQEEAAIRSGAAGTPAGALQHERRCLRCWHLHNCLGMQMGTDRHRARQVRQLNWGPEGWRSGHLEEVPFSVEALKLPEGHSSAMASAGTLQAGRSAGWPCVLRVCVCMCVCVFVSVCDNQAALPQLPARTNHSVTPQATPRCTLTLTPAGTQGQDQ